MKFQKKKIAALSKLAKIVTFFLGMNNVSELYWLLILDILSVDLGEILPTFKYSFYINVLFIYLDKVV